MPKRLVLVVAVIALAWIPYVHSLLSRAPDPQPEAEETKAAPLTAAPEAAPAAPQPAKPVLRFVEPPPVAQPHPPAAPEPDPFAEVSARPAKFRAAFDSETRDAFWANDSEPKLKEMLEAVEFPAEEYTQIACRRTVCRITFKRPRISESRAIALYARVLTGFGDAQLVLHDSDSPEQGQLYVLRQGYKLEAPASR
jgi:hypothetical protein